MEQQSNITHLPAASVGIPVSRRKNQFVWECSYPVKSPDHIPSEGDWASVRIFGSKEHALDFMRRQFGIQELKWFGSDLGVVHYGDAADIQVFRVWRKEYPTSVVRVMGAPGYIPSGGWGTIPAPIGSPWFPRD